MKNLSYIVFLLFFVGCNDMSGKIIHPTKENTPDLNLENVRTINSSSNHLAIDSLSNQLRSLKIEKVISEIEGEYSNQFGFITDVVMDSFKRIYILDARRQDISIFSAQGEFIKKIGGERSWTRRNRICQINSNF